MIELNKKIKRTQETYGLLWEREAAATPIARWHFNDMQDKINVPIVRGNIGIDIGSGCGYDAYIMAKNNPGVTILALDISDGVFKAQNLANRLSNMSVIKGSAADVPLKDDTLDFVYSFGVLHHIPSPEQGLREIRRVLKPGSPLFIYLYEDHSGNPVKHFALEIIKIIRKVTIRIPSKLLYLLSYIASPFVVLLFSYPAKILDKFKATKPLAKKIPFNFGTHPFSLAGDLYDRFGAPLEHRFSKNEISDLFNKTGFININIDRFESKAGWVAWGYKTNV